MSGTQYKEDEYVRCPFYCKESPTDIKCMGLCGDHTISTFPSRRAKEDFKYDFCCSIYTACPLFQAILEQQESMGTN